MEFPRVRPLQALLGLALLGLLFVLVPPQVVRAEVERQTAACSGYYYTVKLGDTWSKIARRVGAPAGVLQAANPQAVRRHDVIYAGEKLCIPSQGGVEQGGYWYQVKPGDTWKIVSRQTGVPLQQLLDANRQLVNSRLWLYIGQRIWIPAPPKGAAVATTPAATTPAAPGANTTPANSATTSLPAAAPSAAPPPPTPTATVPPTPEPTLTATPMPTATPTAMPTAGAPVAPATSFVAATPTTPATASAARPALAPIPAGCPKSLAAYPEALAAYLNRAGNTPTKLQSWLVSCHAVSPDAQGVTVAPITGPKAADVVVVVRDPAPADPNNPQGMLLVYHNGSKGYLLGHKHVGQGRITLLRAADINADGKPDVVYTDSTCGAHTCFGTLFVDSWNGNAYVDMITDEPAMAEPQYTIKDTTPEGQGNEIIVHGGVIQSVGAGPQRAWTETYISSKGTPYVLFSQVYDPSTCLYHKILDANRAFDAWALNGFDPAIEAYKAAIADTSATACGTIQDEVATLRDFARFRLIVADVAAGRATEALPLPAQITNPALKGAATAFLNSYKDNTSVIQACRDTTKYAEVNSASWQFLADWGYANPSFTAQDLCPLN